MNSLQRRSTIDTLTQPGLHIPWSRLSDHDDLHHYFFVDEDGRVFLAGGEEVVLGEPARMVVTYREHDPDYIITEKGRVFSNAPSNIESTVEVDEYGLPLNDDDSGDDALGADAIYDFRELALSAPVVAMQATSRVAVFLLKDGSVYYWDSDVSFPEGAGRILFGQAGAAMVALQGNDLYILTRTGELYQVRISTSYRTRGQDLVATRAPALSVNGRPLQPVCIYASGSQRAFVDQAGRMYVSGELWYGNPGYTDELVEVPVPEPLIDLVIGNGYTLGLGASGTIYYAGRTTTEEVRALLASGQWRWW